MCDFHCLAENSIGVVEWCSSCGNLSLTFNNVLLSVTPRVFGEFKKNLEVAYENFTGYTDSDRAIVFQTKLKGMQLLFSKDEVGTLLALVQEADLAMMFIHEVEDEEI